MTIETMDKAAVGQSAFDVQGRLGELHGAFGNSFAAEKSMFSSFDNITPDDNTLRQAFGLGEIKITDGIRQAAVHTVNDMYNGVELGDRTSLGLREIGSWVKNDSCINQQAGYSAEVISTGKENFSSNLFGKGDVTYRADDLPKELRDQLGDTIAAKNDQYVDKVRVKADGTIEKVQTKFVGKDAESCLKKLMSKEYDKYFEPGKVDKLEVPKEYYDDITKLISSEKDGLFDQLDRVKAEGNTEAAAKIQSKIDKLERLEGGMLEKSVVTKAEAVFATEHPKLYAAQQINNAGLKQGAIAAGLTAAVSGMENYEKYKSGEIDGKEAITNVLKDSGTAGAIAYGTEVITQLAGGSSVPAAVITMGVESADDIKGFIDGEIGGEKLAYNLGENAARVIGGAVGGALGGAAGSVVGPAGTVVGSMAGASAGSAAAAKAYQETVEFISENADEIIEKGSEIAGNIGDAALEVAGDVKETVSDVVDSAAETLDNIGDKASEAMDSIGDKASELKDAAKAVIADFPFWD